MVIQNILILIDRDTGVNIFRNFRGYGNLKDDAEWILERTPERSLGFLIRPMRKNDEKGIWIAEYNNKGLNREEYLFDYHSASLSNIILNHNTKKLNTKKFINNLKDSYSKSKGHKEDYHGYIYKFISLLEKNTTFFLRFLNRCEFKITKKTIISTYCVS